MNQTFIGTLSALSPNTNDVFTFSLLPGYDFRLFVLVGRDVYLNVYNLTGSPFYLKVETTNAVALKYTQVLEIVDGLEV